MQVLQDRVNPATLTITIAHPGYARQVAQLYRNVYGSAYPSPELFTEAGMREFLTCERSHCITSIVIYGDEVIAAGTFHIDGRSAFCRGWMVDPAWQGMMGTRQVFQQILLQARRDLAGKVDYFYGELRTATTKLQAIIEEIGFRPVGTLPFKDAFAGGREAEILYACYYHDPKIGRLRLTPKAARVASAVLQQPVQAVRVFVPPPNAVPDTDFIVEYVKESNGEEMLHIALPSGATLDAAVYPAPQNSDRVAIDANSVGDYAALVRQYLAELEERRIEYAEICVPADAPARQKILEDLGFSPTGFLPSWHAPGGCDQKDCVFYTIHFPSDLPEVARVVLTPKGESLRPFITPAFTDASHMLPASHFWTRFLSRHAPYSGTPLAEGDGK